MAAQEQFYDIPTSTLTPIQIREKLADLAEPIVGAEKVAAIKDVSMLCERVE
jgi:hypothetical protein